MITVKLTPNKGSLGISLLLVSKQKVIVNKVSPNKPAHGKIFIGDVILSVNGKKVRCLSDFGEAIKSNSEEKHKVKLRRARLNRFLGHEHNLLVHRLEGFDYFLFQMNISAGKMSKKPFGAAVVTWRQRVIIGDIQPDSVAQEYFQPLDRVLTVNGTPVNTADQSAQIIKDSDGKLTIMIERPLTDETKMTFKELYGNALLVDEEGSILTERSVWIIPDPKSDVLRIADRELARLKEDREHGDQEGPKPILKEKKMTTTAPMTLTRKR